MKQISITNADRIEVVRDVSKMITNGLAVGSDRMDASDGYHTFTELYAHRIELWITMCRISAGFAAYFKVGGVKEALDRHVFKIWRSKLHSDGTSFDGWFILGMGKEKGKQMTYHLPMAQWEETDFAETLETAPEWDGHTAEDVIVRLKTL